MLAVIHRWGQQLSPSHDFLVRDEKIWARSFQMVKGIIETLGRKRAIVDLGLIKIKGESGKWYAVQPAIFRLMLQPWQVTTLPRGRNVCINIQSQHTDMPLGDQIASVILTLANDIALGAKVQTLARDIDD
jgi:hypothetical protein